MNSLWNEIVLEYPDEYRPVAVGGMLSADTMLGAYERGLFPWPPGTAELRADFKERFGPLVASGKIPSLPGSDVGLDLPWWSPKERALIMVDDARVGFHARKAARNKGWRSSVNLAFVPVVENCARRDSPNRWITDELIASFVALHERGVAHSVEIWSGEQLVGGVFGVQVGGVFCAESRFRRVSEASRIAMLELAKRFGDVGGVAVDCQNIDDDLRRMGAVAASRDDYLPLLRLRGATPLSVTPNARVGRLVSPPMR